MKKLLSILLATLLIFSSVFVGISVTAAETAKAAASPIEAVPFATGSWASTNWEVTSKTNVTPLAFTSAGGVKMSKYAHYDGDLSFGSAVEGSTKSVGAYYSDTTGKWFASDTFIFYLDMKATNELYIRLVDQTSGWAWKNLQKASAFSYAGKGDSTWKNAETTTVTYNDAEYGVIKFAEDFKGYVKLTLSANFASNKDRSFQYIYFYGKGLGGDYGTMTVGPVFNVTKDSTSTKINVDDEYKTEPIEATPVSVAFNRTGSSSHDAYKSMTLTGGVLPLSYTTAPGMKLSSTGYAFDNAALASGNWGGYLNSGSQIQWFPNDTFIVYVKTDSANEIYFRMGNTNDGNYWRNLVIGSEYQFLELDGFGWETAKVASSADASANRGVIKFDHAFEGYIKLKKSTNFGSASVTFSGLFVYPKALGGDYGTVTVGPVFDITKDGSSNAISVPDEWKTQPISAIPVTGFTAARGNSNISVSHTRPLSFTSAEGVMVSPSTAGNTIAGSGNIQSVGSYFYFDAFGPTYTGNTMLVYVDLDSANAFSMKIVPGDWEGHWPVVGTTFQYAAIGDDKWREKEITENGFEFDSAFRGYIKVNLTTNFNWSNKSLKFNWFEGRILNVGGEYGNPVIGPFFVVDTDSNSIEITVPDEYKPGDVKVNPITDYKRTNYYSGTVTCTEYAPFTYTIASGIRMTASNGAYTLPDDKEYASSPVRTTVNMVTPYAIDGMEAFLLYLDMPSANTVYPMFTVDAANISYNVSMALKPGKVYYTLADGEKEWKEHTVEAVCSCGSTTMHGGMVFDSAFKGYVKFDPQNITCTDISAPGKGAYINRFDVCFNNIDGAIVAGPYFSATEDSVSTNITINNIFGDIDKDAIVNENDITALRKYILGYENSFVAANGNVSKDAEGKIDVLDLVLLNGIVDDIVFSPDAYYVADGLGADVKTLSAYVYIPETISKSNTAGVLFGSNNGTAASFINFGIANDGKPVITNENGTVTFDGNVQTGDWAHLAYVIDGANVTVYLDGESLGTQSLATASYKDMTFILGGDNVDGNPNYFKGKLGEVALFSTVLSETEVKAIVAAGTAAGADIARYDAGNTVAGEKMLDEVGNNHLDAYTTFFTEKEPVTDYAYSFAVVGDTQTITASGQPEHLSNIYDWILENKDEKKIEFVMGLGDITDGNQTYEWQNAKTQISKMNGKVPYTVVRGNHDSVSNINTYFASVDYLGQFKVDGEYYGFYADNEADIRNSYRTFTTSNGDKWLVMTLDFGPYDEVLEWANAVIGDAKFKDHKVVITTHCYLNKNGTTVKAGDDGAATGYKYNGDSVAKIATNEDPEWADKTNDGDDIYEKLVKNHSNIVLVLSGHIINDEIVYRQDSYDNGKVVTQMLIDPQGVDSDYSGVGLVAMLYFSNDGNSIEVEYYSTVKEQYFMRENQFTINIANN